MITKFTSISGLPVMRRQNNSLHGAHVTAICERWLKFGKRLPLTGCHLIVPPSTKADMLREI